MKSASAFMRVSSLGRILCLALLVPLAACVTVIRGDGEVTGSAKRDLMTYAKSTGPVLLELKGEAPDLPNVTAEVAQIASSALQEMNVVFTADPARAGRPEYRFVLAFNPADGVSERDLCGSAPTRVQSGAGGTRLLTAFCEGETLLASSIAKGAQIAGPEDPEFKQLIRAGVSETILGRATFGRGRP